MRFTWDPHKAAANRRKHGVTFEEATTVFADPLALLVTDAMHAQRTLIIGESVMRRTLVTVFTERSASEVRIISARRTTKHERRRYEEGEQA
ncbi:MAG: BrnT family toxin [Candidatus Binatia bacterium]